MLIKTRIFYWRSLEYLDLLFRFYISLVIITHLKIRICPSALCKIAETSTLPPLDQNLYCFRFNRIPNFENLWP